MIGLIGKKIGMTQVFDKDGKRITVTVVQAGPCGVVHRKTVEKHGYDAVQLGYEEVAEKKLALNDEGWVSFKITPKKIYTIEFRP